VVLKNTKYSPTQHVAASKERKKNLKKKINFYGTAVLRKAHRPVISLVSPTKTFSGKNLLLSCCFNHFFVPLIYKINRKKKEHLDYLISSWKKRNCACFKRRYTRPYL
jgi:hypothetical protein